MTLGPVWKSQSFWLTIVGAIAAILAGVFTEAEVELFLGAAGLVIAYLVTRGVLAGKVASVNATLLASSLKEKKQEEVNF